jgi:hypothetical protein
MDTGEKPDGWTDTKTAIKPKSGNPPPPKVVTTANTKETGYTDYCYCLVGHCHLVFHVLYIGTHHIGCFGDDRGWDKT